MWWFLLFYVLLLKCLCCLYPMYVVTFLVEVIEWPPIGKIAAHSAYDMCSWYKYLFVYLVFPTSAFGVGISF